MIKIENRISLRKKGRFEEGVQAARHFRITIHLARLAGLRTRVNVSTGV